MAKRWLPSRGRTIGLWRHVLAAVTVWSCQCLPPPPLQPVPGYDEAQCYQTSTSPVCQSLMRSWPSIQAGRVDMNYSAAPFSVARIPFKRTFGTIVPRVLCSAVNVRAGAKPIVVRCAHCASAQVAYRADFHSAVRRPMTATPIEAPKSTCVTESMVLF